MDGRYRTTWWWFIWIELVSTIQSVVRSVFVVSRLAASSRVCNGRWNIPLSWIDIGVGGVTVDRVRLIGKGLIRWNRRISGNLICVRLNLSKNPN